MTLSLPPTFNTLFLEYHDMQFYIERILSLQKGFPTLAHKLPQCLCGIDLAMSME